ncbi:unnamed protein product [marine sediment metagenome]|uniref:Uncharacterized protein n=1 Tax=marine sediment metagenome TaxID=412755 RepID=X0V7S0_9ZZZZ
MGLFRPGGEVILFFIGYIFVVIVILGTFNMARKKEKEIDDMDKND